ncbi:pro-sigmaK processing inhibitor BofA family protein [Oscillospiraceae bacterium OttesenSCG-928-F05]|nr:pro-sigmaK processing inhibitor BofA family protein [Oscillospiraceae bacterium OttesenSCG-928-F05]
MRELLFAGAAVVAILVAVGIFRAPMKLALKLLVNTAIGFVLLVVINLLAPYTGISIGVNVLNALLIGVLGVPGVLLLFILRWILG